MLQSSTEYRQRSPSDRRPRHANGRASRGAYTLVEVLVAAAIIGILVGLLLPAIQHCREAAAQSTCSNNLKQISLAFHNYHSAFGCFPDNQDNDRWGTSILGFVEHSTLASRYSTAQPPWHAVNLPVTSSQLLVYLCPSSNRLSHPEGLGTSHYLANAEVLKARTLNGISDGTGQTALLTEQNAVTALVTDSDSPGFVRAWSLGPCFGSIAPATSGHRSLCWIATAAGGTHRLRADLPAYLLAALETPCGGELFTLPE